MTTHATPTGLSADQLSDRIVNELAAPAPDEGALRALVHALVGAWKEHGWSIERGILQIKRHVVTAQDRRSPSSTWLDIKDLGDRAVTWCIERYYAPGSRS
jgi:hypothetical protein